MDTYKVTLTFTEPLLGTIAKDPEVYAAFVAGKAALTDDQLKEELETVDKVEERGWTGFHLLEDVPVLLDYVIKGFLKDACGMLRRAAGTKSHKVKAHKRVIDGLLFPEPRRIPLVLPKGRKIETIERPLRAQTAQGERVTVARSDTCPAGTTLTFKLRVLGGVTEELLREWFEYGALRGLGQWRNAGYGRFTFTLKGA